MKRTEQNVARDPRVLKGAAVLTEPLAEWSCRECGYDRALQSTDSTRRVCAWCGRPSTSRKRKPRTEP